MWACLILIILPTKKYILIVNFSIKKDLIKVKYRQNFNIYKKLNRLIDCYEKFFCVPIHNKKPKKMGLHNIWLKNIKY